MGYFLKRVALVLLLVFIASTGIYGCGLIRVTKSSPKTKVETVSAALPETMPLLASRQDASNKGSLWKEDNARSFFFQDTKAGFLGDIVTVRVIENASGSKDANTSTGRSSSLSTSAGAFFGLASDKLAQAEASTNFSNSFDGDGSTSRSGSLTAEVTAIVTRVYPNGNMEIQGNREVMINKEKEYLSISGIIRPEDIGPGNTVISTVMADAKIEYSGHGVIDDKQRPGWLMRLIDFIWPF